MPPSGDSPPAPALSQQENPTGQINMSYFETGKTDEETLCGDYRDVVNDAPFQLAAKMSLDDIVQALNELHLSHRFGTVIQRSAIKGEERKMGAAQALLEFSSGVVKFEDG
ncbi:hypothetical protein CKM354_000614800 [Cercospora kikuchii]|uniref:Uncharacterized protein n=1 Tax=Cercospora kikuchii TaxID=84275 RepID=A0A9P3FHY1_9PEZI|nr:uncharacterized protein CKM354_000614800 [Cercospora kikuchii]GIZ42900.1 hypothetical protein CKM354_000614800 [Cercospora kikuchii]